MTTPKAKLAGLALIAALCAGFTLGLTAPAWADWDEGRAAYERGDYATAIREWRPLAKQGYAIAQNSLGSMYRHGDGVAKDFVLAHMWYNLVAVKGDMGSSGDRRSIARDMTPAQISEAQKLAREWRPKK